MDVVWDAELRVWDAKNFGPVSPGTHRNKFVKKSLKHRDAFLSLTKEKVPAPITTNQQSCSSFFPKKEVKEKYPKHDQRQVQLTECLVSFIAGDLLPLSTVESPNFRRIINV